VQLVRENGTLVHRACLLDTEYSSASTYSEALDAARPQWVALLAAEIAEDQQAARALATRRQFSIRRASSPNSGSTVISATSRRTGDPTRPGSTVTA
jgi:hypothetical protein